MIFQFLARYAVPIAVFALALSSLLNFFFRGTLFLHGIRFVIKRQSHATDFLSFLHNMILILSDNVMITVLIVALYVLARRKVTILVYMAFILTTLYLNTLAENILRDPRPFWITPECRKGFANPSLHAASIFPIYQPLLFDIITSKSVSSISLVIPMVLSIAVPVSCLYLGSNSLNQVAFGALIGLCFVCLYRYSLQENIYRVYFGMLRVKGKLSFLVLILANTLCLIIPMALYQIQIRRFQPDALWKSIIALSCHKSSQPINGPLDLQQCIMIQFIFGTLAGSWMSDESTENYMMGQWIYFNEISRRCVSVSKVTRMSLELLLIGVILLMVVFIRPLPEQMRYLLGCLCLWSLGFLMTVVVPKVLSSLDVVVEVALKGDVQINQYYDI